MKLNHNKISCIKLVHLLYLAIFMSVRKLHLVSETNGSPIFFSNLKMTIYICIYIYFHRLLFTVSLKLQI